MDIKKDLNTNWTDALKDNNMDYVNDWWLMGSPVKVALVLITYLIFVLRIGPSYMKNKKPYRLHNIIVLYNASQVLMSVYLVYKWCLSLNKIGFIPRTCDTDPNSGRQLASAMHYYLIAKVIELLDTVFFVLRKKTRQISFLHVYHHTLMVLSTWSALKYEPTAVFHLMILGSLNSFVHVIMYTYYALSTYPSLAKFLWWKKYITSLQLIQFVCVFAHFGISAAVSECSPSYTLTTSFIINTILFFYLFGKFYINNYTKKTFNTKEDIGNKTNTKKK